MIKKSIITLLMFLIFGISAFAAAPDLTMYSATASPGQGISIPVIADMSSPILSAQFNVKYDPALLTFKGSSLGSGDNAWNIVVNSKVPGQLIVGLYGTTTITGVNQQIAVLNFMVNNPPDVPTMALPNLVFSNVLFNETAITSLLNGNFILSLPGDVNGDGKVTIADAVLVAQAAVGLITLNVAQTQMADTSHNGKITLYDGALIAQYVAGLIPKLY